MPAKTTDRNKALSVLIVLVVAIAAGVLYYFTRHQEPTRQPSQMASDSNEAAAPSPQGPQTVVDYDRLQSDPALKAQMDERKAALGVDQGVDFVVRPGESFTVGGNTVPIDEILDKIRLESGEIGEADLLAESGVGPDGSLTPKRVDELTARQAQLEGALEQTTDRISPQQRAAVEKELDQTKQLLERDQALKSSQAELEVVQQQLADATPADQPAIKTRLEELKQQSATHRAALYKSINEGRLDAYGIYVVRPGDNIWDIHFHFLRSYFSERGVTLSPQADEPLPTGASSGVGKLLKFSENMVYIYNLRERKIDADLDAIQPLSKIVVFKLDTVFNLLGTIDYEEVDRIEFDGETLWVPAKR
jgi:hypothetical protein